MLGVVQLRIPRPHFWYVDALWKKRDLRKPGYPSWPRSWPARAVRRLFLGGMVLPAIRIGYRLDVRGRENFEQLRGACLIVSNHNMHLDWGMLLRAMPGRISRRLLIAAAADDIFGRRIRAFSVNLLGNAFPFVKEGSGVRESLEFVTARLEEGWNVLILPEGKLTTSGEMQPFKRGVGWLVVRTGVEVLPMRVDVLRPGLFEGRWRRGHVRVSIGEPVRVEPGSDYSEVAARLEEAVREA